MLGHSDQHQVYDSELYEEIVYDEYKPQILGIAILVWQHSLQETFWQGL